MKISMKIKTDKYNKIVLIDDNDIKVFNKLVSERAGKKWIK